MDRGSRKLRDSISKLLGSQSFSQSSRMQTIMRNLRIRRTFWLPSRPRRHWPSSDPQNFCRLPEWQSDKNNLNWCLLSEIRLSMSLWNMVQRLRQSLPCRIREPSDSASPCVHLSSQIEIKMNKESTFVHAINSCRRVDLLQDDTFLQMHLHTRRIKDEWSD
jgi:hypothetical protein